MPDSFQFIQPVRTSKFADGKFVSSDDALAVEEPLEIIIAFSSKNGRQKMPLSVTMRTPGQDLNLCTGFLLTEGIIQRPTDLMMVKQLDENTALAELAPGIVFDAESNRRNFYISSSCGICGKASVDAVRQQSLYPMVTPQPALHPSVLSALPETLRKQQFAFNLTGGLHAAALFERDGKLLFLQEDVGRHNAVDKVIGEALRAGLELPFSSTILLVSGRAGFELVQKAAMVGISTMAAVGAPTSLSVQLAEAYGMTLVGFLKKTSFNVYSGKFWAE